MNCPKCGLQTLPEQKFCRSCGAGLQMITQPLAEHATVSDLKRTPVISFRDQRANRVLCGFIMMFIGVAIGIIGKKLMHQELVTVVGALVSLAGMFITAYPFLSPSPPKKYDSSPSSQPEVLTQSQPTKSLPQGTNSEYLPSITERTTDLLKSSATSTPKEEEDANPQP